MLSRLLTGACVAASLATPVSAVDYTFLPALPAAGPADMQLLDIARCGSRLLAVGERGLITYSDDGAISWRQADVPVSQTLTAVDCRPDGRAWAVGHGGVVLASDDQGEHWRLQFDGNQANRKWLDYNQQLVQRYETAVQELYDDPEAGDTGDVELLLEDARYALEDAELALETGPADPFLAVWFRDADYGLAVGAYGMVYRTLNGGESWLLRAATIENPDRYHYYGLAAASDENLFLSGEAGLLYRSIDGGETWETLDSGYDGSLFGVLALEDGAVLTFGLRGNILRSEDAGISWDSVPVSSDPGHSLYDGVELGDGGVVLVGAAGIVLQSRDGGRSFAGTMTEKRSTLSGVAISEAGQLFAVGMEGLQSLAGEVP